uniref:Uncharacterized protein n=1 Tax=Arundo donax TaxID=35708 RepID=A0A0A9FH29_ARUDO
MITARRAKLQILGTVMIQVFFYIAAAGDCKHNSKY